MRVGGLITLLALGAMASPAYAATHEVKVGNNAFSPSELTITQGDSVTWTWVGPDTNHSTTTGTQGQTTWDSDPGNPNPSHQVGDKFSRDFPDPGEFSYFCKVHSFMTGKIVVQRKETNPNPPPVDTAAPQFGTAKVQVKRRRVTFQLNEAATVDFRLRGPTRRTKTILAGAGTNVVKLPKRMKRGRYALRLRATDAAGNESLVVRRKFRVR
jgi:plastocyanin